MVETVSVQVNVSPPGSKLEAFVNYTCLGQSVMLFVPLTYAYTDTGTGFDFYVAMQAVRLYADPDTAMTVTVHSPTGAGGHAVSDRVRAFDHCDRRRPLSVVPLPSAAAVDSLQYLCYTPAD